MSQQERDIAAHKASLQLFEQRHDATQGAWQHDIIDRLLSQQYGGSSVGRDEQRVREQCRVTTSQCSVGA